MTVSTNAQPHQRATRRRPTAYRSSMANPQRRPRLVVLRSSCGHVLGVGLVWRRQSYITWASCR